MDKRFRYVRAALAVCAIASAPAAAQTAPEEIIVTARKRDETAIAVPVTLTVVSGSELDRRAFVKFDDLSKMVPQLQIGPAGTTLQGSQIGIRGISGADNNPFADQAVSFNIDGVQVSTANINRMANLDLGQIEVLKGPQALFFGKNSPGGVISIRSADPTSAFQAKVSAGYEFYAEEWRGEGFISGPITDTLGARLAFFADTMNGWFDQGSDNSSVYTAVDKHTPKPKEFGIRGTLKWNPNDNFNARLKVSYNHLDDNGVLGSAQLINCPRGVPQLGGASDPDNCRIDGQGAHAIPGPGIAAAIPGRFGSDGVPYLHLRQALISYEMNYNLNDRLALTSVSGYYYVYQNYMDNSSFAWIPASVLDSNPKFSNQKISEELRLTSNYKSLLDFMIGGYYEKARSAEDIMAFMGAVPILAGGNYDLLSSYNLHQHGESYSAFGQLIVRPLDKVEITGGGRYSYERKQLTSVMAALGLPGAPRPRSVIPETPTSPHKASWHDFSPEFTVSYRPSSDLTVFASYKRGFLSGGFNSGATNFASDLRYGEQVIKGFEGGVKAALLNGDLRTNLSLYRYVVTGLQITSSTTTTAGTVQTVLNAGKTTLKGVEYDADYKTPLQGVSVHGAVGYNDAKYNVFSGGCYSGQTQEAGCNFGGFTSTAIGGQNYTTYALQNLAGRQLLRAPAWSGSAGAAFQHDIGSELQFGLNVDVNFSSSYYTNVTEPAASQQKSWQILDAKVHIGAQNDRWELAVIGDNLTNKFYVPVRSNDVPFTGTGTGRAANDPRGAFLADTQASVNRGRSVMLRLSVRTAG